MLDAPFKRHKADVACDLAQISFVSLGEPDIAVGKLDQALRNMLATALETSRKEDFQGFRFWCAGSSSGQDVNESMAPERCQA